MGAGEDRAQSCHDFLQQMGYREYGRYLSFHFPFIHERSLLAHLRACPWRIDQHAFKVGPLRARAILGGLAAAACAHTRTPSARRCDSRPASGLPPGGMPGVGCRGVLGH
jgi:hypothetical protein